MAEKKKKPTSGNFWTIKSGQVTYQHVTSLPKVPPISPAEIAALKANQGKTKKH